MGIQEIAVGRLEVHKSARSVNARNATTVDIPNDH